MEEEERGRPSNRGVTRETDGGRGAAALKWAGPAVREGEAEGEAEGERAMDARRADASERAGGGAGSVLG